MDDDRAAIGDLVFSYAERIDTGDLEGVADLLAGAVVTAEGTDLERRGRDEVLHMYEWAMRLYDDGTPHTKHVTTNLIVDIGTDGESAASRSYFTVLQAVPGSLALQPIVAGRYHDEFSKDGGAWHFVRRHMIVDLVGDVSQHLPGTPPEAVGGEGTDHLV